MDANIRKLLIVDDEENILRSLTRLLRRDRYEIATASSGEAGLEYLAANQVGVIISDQRMPGMNGTEFLSRAKELRPETVRLMLSGYTDLGSVTEAVNRGAIYRFLTKPWEDDELCGHVREAFEHYEQGQAIARLGEELDHAYGLIAEHYRKLAVDGDAAPPETTALRLQAAAAMIELLPFAVLGIDTDGRAILASAKARETFRIENDGAGLSMPELFAPGTLPLPPGRDHAQTPAHRRIDIEGTTYIVLSCPATLAQESGLAGIITLLDLAALSEMATGGGTDGQCARASLSSTDSR